MATVAAKLGEPDAAPLSPAAHPEPDNVRAELPPPISLQVAHAHEAAALTLNEDPRIAEAVSHLHPLLREALQHELARSDLSIQTAPRDGFSRQSQLLDCIKDLNEKLESLWQTQVERREGYVSELAGDAIMNYLTGEEALLNEGGMLKRILASVKIFAMTKLRDAAKAPSSEPFIPEEFERERVLHKIMERLLRGLNH